MLRNNLWGEVPTLEVKPPIAILKDQAKQLGLMTKGVLEARVVTGRRFGLFELELRIVAPALDDYEYSVLLVHHNVELYPLTASPAWEKGNEVSCADEEEFEAALAEILGSEHVRRVIASLLAQSNAR